MKRKRAVRQESGEPTWVKNEDYGWIPDESPLFDFRFKCMWGDPMRMCVGATEDELVMWDVGEGDGLNGETFDCYQPLTTAARELLAALRAERGGK